MLLLESLPPDREETGEAGQAGGGGGTSHRAATSGSHSPINDHKKSEIW